MLDLKDFLTQVHRRTCRQIVRHAMHMFPVLARESVPGSVSCLSWRGTSERRKNPVSRVLPVSKSSFQLAITNCATETPNAGILAQRGISRNEQNRTPSRENAIGFTQTVCKSRSRVSRGFQFASNKR